MAKFHSTICRSLLLLGLAGVAVSPAKAQIVPQRHADTPAPTLTIELRGPLVGLASTTPELAVGAAFSQPLPERRLSADLSPRPRPAALSLKPAFDHPDATLTPANPDWQRLGMLPVAPRTAGFWSTLGQVVGYQSVELPNFESRALHLTAPDGWLNPFAAIALDSATRAQAAEENSALGFGGGTKLKLSPRADLGTEVLLFPGSQTQTGSNVRVLTSLQIRF